MPCYVAMHEPGAWVVGTKSYGQVTIAREASNVAAGRVSEVECCSVDVKCSGTFGDNEKVVPM